MLKHDCKECGKRLAEMAAACPNCGAPKPPDGWRQIKLPARPFAIAALVFVFLVAGYGLFSGRKSATGDSTPKIEPGMQITLSADGAFACVSQKKLFEYVEGINKGDAENVKYILYRGYCFSRALSGYRYKVTNIEAKSAINDDIVAIRSVTAPFPMTLYVPIRFVTPAAPVTPSSADGNAQTSPTAMSSADANSDVKAGMFFFINPDTPFVCNKKEFLANIPIYSSNGNQEEADKLFDSRYCNTEISDLDILVIDSVEHVDGMVSPVVRFHFARGSDNLFLYTLASFIEVSPSPTSSEFYENTPPVRTGKSPMPIAPDLKPGQLIYLNPKTPFACAGQAPELTNLLKYASNGDVDNFNRLVNTNDMKRRCYGHFAGNVQWKVTRVEKDSPVKGEDTVVFQPASFPDSAKSYYYTLSEFVSISQPSTSSTAN